jgi:hypothetical protein
MKQFEEKQKLQRRLAIEQHVECVQSIVEKVQADVSPSILSTAKPIFDENKTALPVRDTIRSYCSMMGNSSRRYSINLASKSFAPLRESGRIAVNFTARVFPTPMRESQNEAEEQVIRFVQMYDSTSQRFVQWLRKQIESRQASNDLQLDLSDKEKDLDYLKTKAG